MKTNEEEGRGAYCFFPPEKGGFLRGVAALIVDLRHAYIAQTLLQTCREKCKKNHYKESIHDISFSISLSYSLLLLFLRITLGTTTIAICILNCIVLHCISSVITLLIESFRFEDEYEYEI